jgi:hypothetical protein
VYVTEIEAIMTGIIGPLLIVTPAAVILLRPLTKKLADFLVAAAEEKRAGAAGPRLEDLRTVVDRLESRLALTEERLSFQERLLADRSTAGDPVRAPREASQTS